MREWFGEGPIYRELSAEFLTSGVIFPSEETKQQYIEMGENFRRAQYKFSDAVSETIIQDRGLSHRASQQLFYIANLGDKKFRYSSNLKQWGIKSKKVPNSCKTYPRYIPDIPDSSLAILVAFSKEKFMIDWYDSITPRDIITIVSQSPINELKGMVIDASHISIGNRTIPLDDPLTIHGIEPGSALLLIPGVGFAPGHKLYQS